MGWLVGPAFIKVVVVWVDLRSPEVRDQLARFSADTTALAANVQTEVPAKYKSPLSVGLGFGWQIGKARINASGEWFDRIEPYVVLQGDEFVTQEPAETRSFEVVKLKGFIKRYIIELKCYPAADTVADNHVFSAYINRSADYHNKIFSSLYCTAWCKG